MSVVIMRSEPFMVTVGLDICFQEIFLLLSDFEGGKILAVEYLPKIYSFDLTGFLQVKFVSHIVLILHGHPVEYLVC